ncbi:MAG: sensor histidine kinase [Ferruginibacter sp.]
MKRVLLHIAFWIVYLLQDVVLIFLLDISRVQHFTVTKGIITAVENCLVLVLPKLLFTYLMLYVIIDKMLKEGNLVKSGILYSLLALTGTLLLYRAISIYFIYPVIYGWSTNVPPYFNLLGFLVGLMDIGFASGAAIVIKQIRLQLAAKEKEKNLTREKLETELKFLRNQTNPHFLFNTLNNIYALARKKSDDTPEVVMKLSKLLRFMLYETKKPSINIGDEIKMLDDYIELERIRYNGRLTINFLREIDNEMEQISPLVLLPFVENAFKHGASESRFESYIHIDMKLQKSLLNFNIENTKENNDNNGLTENIGLTNVRRQLELIYSDYDIKVQNETSVFKIALTINLLSHAKI